MGTLDSKLSIDVGRWLQPKGDPTGIFVRVRLPPPERGWVNADIWYLSRASLLEWLRHKPHNAEHVVLALLGWPPSAPAQPREDS